MASKSSTYILEFKTKIADLEINASENYIEKIEIKSPQAEHYKKIKGKRPGSGGLEVVLLSSGDYCRLHHLYALINLLDDYFSNKLADFCKIPVNFSFYSDFTKKILNALRDVRYGEILSYKGLAHIAGYGEKYSRACATALSINKTPIVVPCHRIITAGGKLGGYSGGGGTHFKAKLLLLEQNNDYNYFKLSMNEKIRALF